MTRKGIEKLLASSKSVQIRMYEPPPAEAKLPVPEADQTFFYTAGRLLSFFPKVNSNGMAFFKDDCEKVAVSLRGSLSDVQHCKPGYPNLHDPGQLKNTSSGSIIDYLVHDEGIDIVVKNEREVVKAMGFDESEFIPGQGKLAFYSQECDFSPLTASWIVVSSTNPSEIIEEVPWLEGTMRGFRMSMQIDGVWKYHLENNNPVYLRVRPSAFSGVGHVLNPADSSADVYKYAADASIKNMSFMPGLDVIEDTIPTNMVNGPRPQDEALGAGNDPFGVGDDNYDFGNDNSWMADDFKNHPDLIDHEEDDLVSCMGDVPTLNDSAFAAVYTHPDPASTNDPTGGPPIKKRLFRVKDDTGLLDRHRLITAYHALCGLRGDVASARALPSAVRSMALARVRKGLYQTNKLSKEISQVMTDAERDAIATKEAEIKALSDANSKAITDLKAEHEKAIASLKAEFEAQITTISEEKKALAAQNEAYVQEKTVASRLTRLNEILPFTDDEKKADTFEPYSKSLASMTDDRFETELLRRENSRLKAESDKAIKAVASAHSGFPYIPSFVPPTLDDTQPELPSVLDY